ncbi:ribonuclease H-like domain-containing protein [Acetoanaerobium sticklandii]|uniref:ribonuclease H-like domain-containing protein n=1 Tax=Acetoanaerobium sticklandii TaxID=1511 RepID=UPI003A8FE1D4
MLIKDYFILKNDEYKISKKSFYFDIETTGLNSKYDSIILICAAFYYSDNEILIRQYFAEDIKDEKSIILYFLEDIASMKRCINFNGNTFDLPFLKKRISNLSIKELILDDIESIDILSYLRPLKKVWNFENLKLKTVEKFFSIERQDTISGKESVDMYKLYQKTKNDSLKEKILLHNYEDVNHLILLENRIYIEVKKRSREINSIYGDFYIHIYDYKIDKNKIVFIFLSEESIPNMNIFRDDGDSVLSYGKTLRMTLMVMTGQNENNQEVIYLNLFGKNIPIFIDKILFEDGIFYALNSFFIA